MYGLAMASDESFVYVGGDTLTRIPVTGGTPEVLFTVPPDQGHAHSWIATIAVGPSDLVLVTVTQDASTLEGSMALVRVPRSGGAATTLDTSPDPRAYRGVMIEGSYVYYGTHTALLRVPLAGGQVRVVAQSPGPVLEWVLSPRLVGDTIYWAEAESIYEMQMDDADGRGQAIARLPWRTSIIGVDDKLVVSLSEETSVHQGFRGFVEIDLASGAAGSVIPFLEYGEDAVATEDAVWVPTDEGLFRIPRDGGAPEKLTTEPSFLVTATSDAVFVMEESSITRIAR